MDQGADFVADLELGDPAGHGFLAVGHGDDLLPLQCQQEELLAFRFRLAGALGCPPVQLVLNVPQQVGLE